MAHRLILRIFKGTTESQFHGLVEDLAREMSATLRWGVRGVGRADFRLSTQGDVHSIFLPNQKGDFPFMEKLGRKSGLPWIELRIQEGAIWDYALYQGDQCVDLFSVCPQYWSDPPQLTVFSYGSSLKRMVFEAFGSRRYDDMDERLAEWKGKPAVLAELWGLPKARIERYLVNWGIATDPKEHTFQFTLSGRAYPDDQFEYGNYEQFFDMLRVLGGKEPLDLHTLELSGGDQKNVA